MTAAPDEYLSVADLAAQLRALADRLDTLEPARVVGELETLKCIAWTAATVPAVPAAPAPSRALDVGAVMNRTGMSRGWLYRQARAGRLPFARRYGRRVMFDEVALNRWLDRRPR